MSEDKEQTKPASAEFDFSAFPENTLFHERRTGRDRRKNESAERKVEPAPVPAGTDARRAKKERRRRIDPTTFEKQYTTDELEFMNAMQRFKEASGKSFPSHGEVLRVAVALGYRRVVIETEPDRDEETPTDDTAHESMSPGSLPQTISGPFTETAAAASER
jgi:hypothetical protein